jgi:hypothetical protein
MNSYHLKKVASKTNARVMTANNITSRDSQEYTARSTVSKENN